MSGARPRPLARRAAWAAGVAALALGGCATPEPGPPPGRILAEAREAEAGSAPAGEERPAPEPGWTAGTAPAGFPRPEEAPAAGAAAEPVRGEPAAEPADDPPRRIAVDEVVFEGERWAPRRWWSPPYGRVDGDFFREPAPEVVERRTDQVNPWPLTQQRSLPWLLGRTPLGLPLLRDAAGERRLDLLLLGTSEDEGEYLGVTRLRF